MVKDDVLKCHDLSTAQRYSEYCQRAVKKTCHHANLVDYWEIIVVK